MKKVFVVMLVGLFLIGAAGMTYAAGTAAEAKTMMEKAVAFYKANGKDKAFAEFSDQKGQFIKEDLYIFVIDTKGMTHAHGGSPKLVGKDMSGLKDADGKFFIKELIEAAKAKGTGWFDYKWTNPTTKKAEMKSTHFVKEGDFVFGCGIYKK